MAGFIHPTELSPAAMRAALMLENMPATTGVDADVPATPYSSGTPVIFDGTKM
jgi:hypothetical protein